MNTHAELHGFKNSVVVVMVAVVVVVVVGAVVAMA